MLLDTPQDIGHKDRCGRILTAKPLGPPAPDDMTAQSVGGVGQEVGQRWTGQKLQKEMAEERQRRGQDRPRLGKTGPRWGQNGPKMGPLWSKMEPRWAKMGPRWRQDGPRWSQDGTRWVKMRQDGPTCSQDAAKMGQDGDKMGRRLSQGEPFHLHFYSVLLRCLVAGLNVPRNGRGTTKTGPR